MKTIKEEILKLSNAINEGVGTYFVENIDPNTKWSKTKDEGNGVVSQETDREYSKKSWRKRFFFRNNPSYFLALFVWGYFPFVFKNGEYQKISTEEFKRKVKNYSELEKIAKKEYISIANKQSDRSGSLLHKENKTLVNGLKEAYKNALPNDTEVRVVIEKTKSGTDFPLEIFIRFFKNGSLFSRKRLSFNENNKTYKVYEENGDAGISNKEIEKITTKAVRTK